jgi:hypothetical protein
VLEHKDFPNKNIYINPTEGSTDLTNPLLRKMFIGKSSDFRALYDPREVLISSLVFEGYLPLIYSSNGGYIENSLFNMVAFLENSSRDLLKKYLGNLSYSESLTDEDLIFNFKTLLITEVINIQNGKFTIENPLLDILACELKVSKEMLLRDVVSELGYNITNSKIENLPIAPIDSDN